MDGEALSREVPSARADAARRRASGRRQSGARTESAPARARRGSWLARLVRLVTIALVLLGLAGIGVAASAPGTASSPRELLNALLDPSAPRAPSTPALASSAGGEVWLAPARPTSRERAATGHVLAASSSALDAGAPRSAPPGAAPAPAGTAPAPCPPPASSAPALAPGGLVVLNRADVSELMRLPGIGRRRAEAIVELRERLGGFKRPSDLLRVRGIGTRSLERLLPLMVVDQPTVPGGK